MSSVDYLIRFFALFRASMRGYYYAVLMSVLVVVVHVAGADTERGPHSFQHDATSSYRRPSDSKQVTHHIARSSPGNRALKDAGGRADLTTSAHQYDVFGVKMTLKKMAVVAMVIWGMVLALVIYYRTYVRERQERKEQIRLDREYSRHSAVEMEAKSSRGNDLQLGSLANARTPPRSIRTKVVLPKRQPKATAVTDVAVEDDLLS